MADVKFDEKPKVTKTPKTPNANKKGLSGMTKIMIAFGVVILFFVIAVTWAVMKPKKPSQDEMARQMALEAQQMEEVPQQELVDVTPSHGLDADLLSHMDERFKASPNFWAIEKLDAEGAPIDPLYLLANQMTESILVTSPFYSKNPVGILSIDGTEVIAIDATNPQSQSIYDAGVMNLRNRIAQTYDIRMEDILVNDGANTARGVVLTEKSTGSQITNLAGFQRFEEWVMTIASENTLEIIGNVQGTTTMPETQENVAEAQALVDNERMKAVIDTLNDNLEQARRESENKAREVNELHARLNQQDEQMAKFLQQLENNPKVNEKLNYSTLAKQAPNLSTTAVIGDRVFLQDNHGVQYSAKVGDVIQLPDGKKLVLTDADRQTVIVE